MSHCPRVLSPSSGVRSAEMWSPAPTDALNCNIALLRAESARCIGPHSVYLISVMVQGGAPQSHRAVCSRSARGCGHHHHHQRPGEVRPARRSLARCSLLLENMKGWQFIWRLLFNALIHIKLGKFASILSECNSK